MFSDQVKIDPVVLEEITVLIDGYAEKQKDLLNKLTTSVYKLSDEWDDSKSFGDLYKHLETINKRSVEMFEQIKIIYKKFYYDEVLNIRKNLKS